MDYVKLSREASYALRHASWKYELELVSYGWVDNFTVTGISSKY